MLHDLLHRAWAHARISPETPANEILCAPRLTVESLTLPLGEDCAVEKDCAELLIGDAAPHALAGFISRINNLIICLVLCVYVDGIKSRGGGVWGGGVSREILYRKRRLLYNNLLQPHTCTNQRNYANDLR